MGNFLVSSACRVHGRSEAVYAIVKAQVTAFRGLQLHGSSLQQRRCAAQQAALLRALSSNVTLTTAVVSCWAAAATARARAALVASLVLIAKKFVAHATPQRVVQSLKDEDDVFDEFHAVFETSSRPLKTIRELQYTAKRMAKEGATKIREDEAGKSETDEIRDDLDDEYEMLPEPKEDWAFYADREEHPIKHQESKTEGERLLQLVSSISDTLMHVEEFLRCGKHNNFETITKDVDELAAEASDAEKRSIVRVLLAYCVYNEDLNYSSDMVVTAGECLRVWQGDEDRAFKSLAVLCHDVPRLCAALE